MQRPQWLDWELVLTSHVLRRMAERGLTEVELRTIVEAPASITPAADPSRFEITGRIDQDRWLVVVDADPVAEVLIAVTAYPIAYNP